MTLVDDLNAIHVSEEDMDFALRLIARLPAAEVATPQDILEPLLAAFERWRGLAVHVRCEALAKLLASPNAPHWLSRTSTGSAVREALLLVAATEPLVEANEELKFDEASFLAAFRSCVQG